jgi:hypothetical protein
MMKTYEIDCSSVSCFEDFIAAFNRAFPVDFGITWDGSLDAFNDYLSWPKKKYQLNVKNSKALKSALGYNATVERLEVLLKNCHPQNIPDIQKRIFNAKSEVGPTLYDELLKIFEENKEFVEVIQN